jgi:hypothetical protein
VSLLQCHLLGFPSLRNHDLVFRFPRHRLLSPGLLLDYKLLIVPSVVLVGKKNLEVRPIAINKVSIIFSASMGHLPIIYSQGEIVKRILYTNPDAEFIFCAGDDKVRIRSLPIVR